MGHPEEPCCGCVIGAQREEEPPALCYSVTKTSSEHPEFIDSRRLTGRSVCARMGVGGCGF